jgi:hypothetical protein
MYLYQQESLKKILNVPRYAWKRIEIKEKRGH